MIKLNYYEIEEVTICPYCGTETAEACCGEVHNETAYLYQDETYRVDEVELYKPILDMIQYETRRVFRKSFWNLKKRQFRNLLCKLYDGHNSKILKLRQLTKFQWTKLDCLILRQLHDFPLYYTKPKAVSK